MATTNPAPKFAICIATDDPDLLTPRMVYEILPDEDAAKSNYVRVVDNEGEDYLYPMDYFVFVNFPATVKNKLRNVPLAGMRKTTEYQIRAGTRHVSEK